MTSEQQPRAVHLDPAATLVACVLCLLAAAAPLLDDPRVWPLAVLAAAVALGLLHPALHDGSIAAPVVVLVLASTATMWTDGRPAIGAIAGSALAISLGEHLSLARADRYRTPGSAPAPPAASAVVHGGAALAAMLIVGAVAALPGARAWSAGAVAAILVITVALHRRRRALPPTTLPPPPPPLPLPPPPAPHLSR